MPAVWYGDWQRTAGATMPIKSRGVLGTTRHRGRRSSRTRTADGKQETPGSSGEGRNEFTDVTQVTAQQHHRPCGSGGHRGTPPDETDAPQATRETPRAVSRMERGSGGRNQRPLLLWRAGVWAALRGRGTQREGVAGSQVRHGDTTQRWRAHPGTCGDGPGCSRGSLEHRDSRDSGGQRDACCHARTGARGSPASPPARPAVRVDAAELGQREAGVPRNSLGDVGGGRREETRTRGEKWFACRSGLLSLFSEDLVA